MTIFETIRRANADWYTANPFTNLSETQLAHLAEQTGMTVDELIEHLTTPHIKRTCPLCGQPQTHLVVCKGCGGGAWGGEFELDHGQPAATQLQDRLRERLILVNLGRESNPHIPLEQIHHAASHAYTLGGCMICATCWNHTLPAEAFRICPLRLLSEIRLNPISLAFHFYLWAAESEDKPTLDQWLASVFAHWTEHWNTTTGEAHEAIAQWRSSLLIAAFTPSTAEERRTNHV